MAAQRQQLALAEAMSFGAGMEVYVEGSFARGLFESEPGAMTIWRAIGVYNRFFALHQQYYTGTESHAPITVVLDDRSESVSLADGLASRHVLFDVIYERDLAAKNLAAYKAVALLTARTVRAGALAALEKYVAEGGRLIAAGDAATRDEHGQERPRPEWFGKASGKGECTFYEQVPPLDDLAKSLSDAAPPAIRVEAPAGVLFNITEQPAAGRALIHLLNYAGSPSAEIRIVPPKRYARATLLSPDSPEAVQLSAAAGGTVELKVPSVRIYSVVVLESRLSSVRAITLGKPGR
jgi:hypothetical protein